MYPGGHWWVISKGIIASLDHEVRESTEPRDRARTHFFWEKVCEEKGIWALLAGALGNVHGVAVGLKVLVVAESAVVGI